MVKNSKNLIYLTDIQKFGELGKFKLLDEAHVRFFVEQSGGRNSDPDLTINLLKNNTTTLPEYRKLCGEYDAVDHYDSLKHLFNYAWCLTDAQDIKLYGARENKEVFIIPLKEVAFNNKIKSEPELLKQITEYYDNNVRGYYKITFERFIKSLYEQLVLNQDCRIHGEPALISWNKEDYAFKKFDPDFVQQGCTKNWDSFLNRLDYPEVFCAWIWSIFEPQNEGRQALWLYGEGLDGKSTAIKAISRIFGLNNTFAVSHGSYKEKWFFSDAYGKKLATYSDCKNPRLISEARIHQLLGGDIVNVEYKGQLSFPAKVYSKLIIGSNLHPSIDPSRKSEATRLIYLEVQPMINVQANSYYENYLVDEAPAFLYKCRELYKKYYPLVKLGNGIEVHENNLKLPEDLQEKIKIICSSDENSIIERFLQEEVEWDTGDSTYVRFEDLRSYLKEYLSRFGMQEKLYYTLNDMQLKLKHKNVEKKQVRKKSGRFYAYVGIKLTNRPNIEEEDE